LAEQKKKRKKQNNIIPYERRTPPRINIGLLIIGFIFLQMLIYVIMYFNTNHIERYEVREGSLTMNNIYTGIALREEQIVENPSAGYINFFIYDGERTAVGDLVYSVDETGKLERRSGGDYEESNLTEKELREFRSDIVHFMHGFREDQFESIYDFKHTMKNAVVKISNMNYLKNMEELSSSDVINYCYAPGTGIVEYWTDGYEGKKPEDLSEEDFKKEKYNRKEITGTEVTEKDAPAYKLCKSELWNVVIPIDTQTGVELEKQSYVKVRFLKNQYEAWASATLINGKDNKSYISLGFNNSMVTFASDRFLDVELFTDEEKGLKIPCSAIVEKEFFLLEEPYLIDEDRKGKRTLIRQCYLDDGTISTERLTVDIYSYDEKTKKYYVDATLLNTGDILHQLDSQETDVVREKATLIGVYNINKGYADFREINILYQNDEYAIVKSGTEYGLKVYDYIVLNADAVNDQQFINQ